VRAEVGGVWDCVCVKATVRVSPRGGAAAVRVGAACVCVCMQRRMLGVAHTPDDTIRVTPPEGIEGLGASVYVYAHVWLV
jgi:hypothetical protein